MRTILAIVLFLSAPPPAFVHGHDPATPYDAAKTEAWRTERERALRSETGWLTVAGLAFLEEGTSTVGSDRDSDIVLPGDAPASTGRIVRRGADVTFHPSSTATLTVNGTPLAAPVRLTRRDRISAGAVSFHLHSSGSRLALRIRDANSELRRTFKGLRWFAIDLAWVVDARYVPYPEPLTLEVPNVMGDPERITIPGEVVFDTDGKEVRLQAAKAGTRLWIIFRDGLMGRETYRIRFLYADAPSTSGRVLLDFNRAYNPPCAYNPYTTCPLPPPQNRLGIQIPAGERIPLRLTVARR